MEANQPLPPADTKTTSTVSALWVIGPFLSILTLVAATTLVAFIALVYVAFNEENELLAAALFALPLIVWILALVFWLAAGRRSMRRTGESRVRSVLLGGVAIPLGMAALLAANPAINSVQERFDDQREERSVTLWADFSEAAYPGFSDFDWSNDWHDPLVDDICDHSGMGRTSRRLSAGDDETAQLIIAGFEEEFVEQGWDFHSSNLTQGLDNDQDVVVLVGHRDDELIQVRLVTWIGFTEPQLHYRVIVGRCIGSNVDEVIEAALVGSSQ